MVLESLSLLKVLLETGLSQESRFGALSELVYLIGGPLATVQAVFAGRVPVVEVGAALSFHPVPHFGEFVRNLWLVLVRLHGVVQLVVHG